MHVCARVHVCCVCVCLHVHTGIVKACRETGGSKLEEALNFEKFQKTVPPKKRESQLCMGIPELQQTLKTFIASHLENYEMKLEWDT